MPASKKSRSKSPSGGANLRQRKQAPSAPKGDESKSEKIIDQEGANWVDGGLGNGTMMVPFLLFTCPLMSNVVAYATSKQAVEDGLDISKGLIPILTEAANLGPIGAFQAFISMAFSVQPTWDAVYFLAGFMGLALLLDSALPGPIENGPETLTGHVPKYVKNLFI